MKTRSLLLFLICMTLSVAAAFGQGPARRLSMSRIDSQSVWHPPSDFRKLMDKECSPLSAPEFQRCFISLMRKLGASDQALEFTSMTDTTAYVRYFRNTGRVDIAYVFYPFRANENFGVYLVNGRPGIIDVDELSILDLPELKKDPTYLAIVRKFPDAALWPGDRYHVHQPTTDTLPDATIRFFVDYLLQNGCHACEHIGVVRFAFEFDPEGRFLGTRLVSVNPIRRPNR